MAKKVHSRKGSNTRKAKRNNTRKAKRNNTRKGRRCGGMWGGAYDAAKLSMAQGEQFLSNYPTQRVAQSGGAYGNYSGFGAPMGDQGLLDPALRDMARIQPLDTKLTEISGMRDPDQMGEIPAMPTMKGGRRNTRKASKKSRKASKKSRKASKKSRKASKKSRKASKKSRKGSRKASRKQRGGSYGNYSGSGEPLSAPNMLLSSSEAAKAGTADFRNPLLKA